MHGILFSIARVLFMFTVVSVVVVETIGYFWHRFVEHQGWFGDGHWVHHEEDYPIEALRPETRPQYKSAGSWSWYLVAGVTLASIFILLPLHDAIPIAIGGILYAWFVVNYFHEVFHLPHHWLHCLDWFRELITAHDIHHCRPYNCNYGIVFFWMDRIFGTFQREFLSAKEDIFPSFKE